MKKWNNNKDFNKPSAHVVTEERVLKGTRVEVRNNDVNYALRKLKKILEREDLQKDLAKKEYYEKPSVKRRRARETAIKLWQKEVEKMRIAGTWNDSSSNKQTKLMKSKRKRRRKLGAREQIVQAHRKTEKES
jgi:small subunit ribosomal protein S21